MGRAGGGRSWCEGEGERGGSINVSRSGGGQRKGGGGSVRC